MLKLVVDFLSYILNKTSVFSYSMGVRGLGDAPAPLAPPPTPLSMLDRVSKITSESSFSIASPPSKCESSCTSKREALSKFLLTSKGDESDDEDEGADLGSEGAALEFEFFVVVTTSGVTGSPPFL